jgi:hypothetical protein
VRTARSPRVAQTAGSVRSLELLRPAQNKPGERLPYSVADAAVYTLIFLMGAFQLTHYPHSADFMNDVTYPDLARSILEKGSYQLRFLPQTTFPPGFPLILAAVGLFLGLSPAALFPVIAVSATLALIAAYELLRRVEGRGAAAAACLLLASSPVLFGFNTTVVYPEMSFFLMSMLALLLALKIDRVERGRSVIGWVLLLSVALVLAVLIRSVGVALLAGLATWIAISLPIVPEMGRRRMKRFLLPLVLGLTAQLSWMMWAHRHEAVEWQLPGYPQSYISQLRVKDGNYPELGLARLSDIPSRVGRNIVLRAAGFAQLLMRRNVSKFWSSPAVFGLLLLIAIGLGSSLWNGGQLHDWYFLWHEFIFMVWPWNYGDRFVIPIVPLACLYVWRGAEAFKHYSIHRPRAVGLVLLGSNLCISSAAFAFRVTAFPVNPGHVRGDHLQTIAATLFWGILTAIGFGMLKSDSLKHLRDGSGMLARLSQIVESRTPLALRWATIVVLTAIVVSGTVQAVAVGRYNMHPDITEQPGYPMIKAAGWIRTHEPSDRVIMARDSEFIFHFTYRRVVWFPPISDPKVLMDGIRRHHVGVVLVVHHSQSYWLPAEDACFQSLLQAYPGAFHLVHQDVDTWVYEVTPPLDGQLGASTQT